MESESSMDVQGETSLDQNAPPLVPDPDSSSFVPSERDEVALELHDMVLDAQSVVLTNDDLLSLIFSFQSVDLFRPWDAPAMLQPDSSTKGRNLGSLLQASLTCKAFFHPAIRALWQSMNSIVPLLKLIPGVVKDGENDSLIITRVIAEEDLLRFDFYAQFIRRFELSAYSLQDFTKNGIVMGDMIFLLVQGYRPRGLLPALQVLEVMHSVRLRVEDVWLLQLLVPSTGTLARLSILGKPSGGEGFLAASILKSAHIKSPTMSVIVLDDCRDWAILNVLKDIKSLKRISLDLRSFVFIHESQFENPGSMVNLVTLQLCGSVMVVHKIFCTVFPHTPQLRILNISRLTSTGLRVRKDAELLRQLADGIMTRTDLSLDSLTIETAYFAPELLKLGSSLRHFNGPSSSCQKLRTLSISISDLSSATFTKLFHVPYRSLVSLEITSGIASHRQYGFKTSLAILELIHNMAPNLRYLYIPIFLNTGDGVHFKSTDGPKTCHGLQELGLKSFQLQSAMSNAKDKYPESHFPSQNFADLLTIARYFDHLFPHLKKINTRELRKLVEERWLDGLEEAVKHFGDQRRLLDWDCKVCGK